MTALRFRVRGMDCADEVGVLREALGPLVGQGGDLAFDVLNGRMIITPGSGASDQTAIIAAVRATGMTAEPWTDVTADGAPDEGSQQRGRTLLTA
jgi:Cd2+/Zn2+-exporting ATPase